MVKRRTLGIGLAAGLWVLAAGAAVGCSSGGGEEAEGRGTLRLPLVTEGASGMKYRLRDATFEIVGNRYDLYGSGAGGDGGADPASLRVSSEDDPAATSIAVSVERGSYTVRLLPGWHMEKVDAGEATVVEATLLSNETQWVYVSPHSSSWVEYEFGIGDRKLWFNGQLNINLRVHEDPRELYGNAGQGGDIDPAYAGHGSVGGYGG